MKVKLVYRNYKPLHSIYSSLISNPPSGVEYIVAPPLTHFKGFYKIYKKLRWFGFIRFFIRKFERFIFLKKTGEDIDIYQYVNIIDESPPDKPYLVDIEHALGLISFSSDKSRLVQVNAFLRNPNCKAINCMSKAAQKTLKNLLGVEYEKVAKKVHVIYPALRDLDSKDFKPDYSIIPKNDNLKILFVGTPSIIKGLEELLEALKIIQDKFPERIIETYIISADAAKYVKKYKLKNIHVYKPGYNRYEIFTKFFIPADVYLLPTKQDTFGMAVLDSLCAGTTVISTKQFALPELINDGEDGILIPLKDPLLDRSLTPTKAETDSVALPNLDNELAKKLAYKIEEILDKKIDLRQMGINAQRKFKKQGKFSIDTRNRKLKIIYNEALRDRAYKAKA